jgi:hypothetical protein
MAEEISKPKPKNRCYRARRRVISGSEAGVSVTRALAAAAVHRHTDGGPTPRKGNHSAHLYSFMGVARAR